MRALTANSALAMRLFPFLHWLPAVKGKTLRPDIEAGLAGAILVLPQAIAFATLAGMPPEYGIYTSIFPVIVAAVWGASWHTLSGPNTAVCVLIAFSVAPFAGAGTEQYIGYVLALTLMVGIIQFSLGILRLGAVLDFISLTVISAVVLAVALIIIVSAASSFLGRLSNLDEALFIRLYQVVHDIPHANGFAVVVGAATIVSGFIARRFWPRYSLVLAVLVGSLCSVALNLLYGPATTRIELLGHLSISLLPLSWPGLDLESATVLRELVTSAFAIAFLGLMQTVVISRSLAAKSGQHIDTNQEIMGQGLANLVAPFVSSFAGSGSINRSAAHYEAGARTPMAAIFAALLLGFAVWFGAPLIAHLPMPAIAGALILVGYRLIDLHEIKRVLRSRHEAVIFFLTFAVALGFGLNAGVFTGLTLSLVIYLWYASAPIVSVEEYSARDGREVQAVTIDGGLFFGSLRRIERILAQLREHAGPHSVLLLRTDHMTYIDVPGAAMITAEAKRRRDAGGDFYIYVTRDRITRALQQAAFTEIVGEDRIMQRDLDHPMLEVLWPYGHKSHAAGLAARSQLVTGGAKQAKSHTISPTTNIPGRKGETAMQDLARRLKATKLYSPLSLEQLILLLEQSRIRNARAGEIIVRVDQPMRHHLVIVEGELEATRSWTAADGNTKNHTRILRPKTDGEPVIITVTHGLSLRAVTDVRYVPLDGDSIDALLEWSQQITGMAELDPRIKQRMQLARQVSVFRQLPLENLHTAFERMMTETVQAGQTVIRQGDAGDSYYLIESGEAEVWRTDPFTEETALVANLGPGDAFGEEALLQGGYRNATVKMTTPGQLLVLAKADFDELVKPDLVEEVTPDAALDLVKQGNTHWLDCRYDMEYEESRIPDAQLVPLDQLRELAPQLDPAAHYVVYCRSGRRSKAAAFLLRERHIQAVSLAGGIKDWPYEVDTRPLSQPD